VRPDWPKYFLDIANAVAARADCTRRRIGCVIVDPQTHDIIQTGYNGAPTGQPGCLDGACPRGLHYERTVVSLKHMDPRTRCGCGKAWPCKDAVDPASSYDTGPGACIAIHAEANALIRAGKLSRGAHMYVTAEPCGGCVKMIHGAGIAKVVWPHGLWDFTE
jgi:dCMP deaminase